MPLKYDDIDGSWGVYSQGWPSIVFSSKEEADRGFVACSREHIVPYGSYVLVGLELRVEDAKYVGMLRSHLAASPYRTSQEVIDAIDGKPQIPTDRIRERLKNQGVELTRAAAKLASERTQAWQDDERVRRMQTQSDEFKAVDALSTAYKNLPCVVDDDYPQMRHQYESAIKTLVEAMKKNGRF